MGEVIAQRLVVTINSNPGIVWKAQEKPAKPGLKKYHF